MKKISIYTINSPPPLEINLLVAIQKVEQEEEETSLFFFWLLSDCCPNLFIYFCVCVCVLFFLNFRFLF